ncbi:MAG: response regulator with CheY-like receiver, AAA-type ATPase, and DNA-binding domain [Planctomycetota bacterium]|nr:response regulator with CheY-like receiver, AAA-type ATPase, and DNA-binding domain [Planctomycetota bacterium]
MNTPLRILIVDDEPNVRLMFRTSLEQAGYALEEAIDGEDALERHREAPADLILLDLQMPRLDGMATLRRLRDEGQNVPVVIVTAHGSIPDAVAAMRLGAIDFLSKPLTPETLRKVVSEVVRRHTPPVPRLAPIASPAEVITPAVQFAENMIKAKRSLNLRAFDEAEVYLKQAIGLDPRSAEAHNLKGVLHELRNEHDASYREYKAALKADRHYEPAKHNMTRYYERFTFGRSEIPVDIGEE